MSQIHHICEHRPNEIPLQLKWSPSALVHFNSSLFECLSILEPSLHLFIWDCAQCNRSQWWLGREEKSFESVEFREPSPSVLAMLAGIRSTSCPFTRFTATRHSSTCTKPLFRSFLLAPTNSRLFAFLARFSHSDSLRLSRYNNVTTKQKLPTRPKSLREYATST